MTTIVDPAGSPTIYFRDQSVTIVSVVATGSDGSDAAQLTRYSAINVVKVTTTGSDQGVKLPAAEEGDFFEIYPLDNGIKYYTSAGSLIGTGGYKYLRYLSGAWRSLT